MAGNANATPDIDISDGLVPKAAAPANATPATATPSTGDAIDISDGLVPKAGAGIAAAPPPPQLNTSDQIKQLEQAPYKPEAPAQPPQNHKEEIVKSVAGDTGLGIYRQSLNTVRKVESILQSPSELYDAAKQELKDHLTNAYAPEPYNLNPAQHELRAVPIAPEAAASKTADAALSDPAAIAERSALKVNPYRNASKIEPAVDKAVAKAGLPAGTQGVTAEEATAANTAAKAEAAAATQRNVDQTLQDITQQHSTTHGLPAPKAGTATRDLLQNNGNALLNSAKQDYATLDKYTDGKFTNVAKELKNAQTERTMSAGKTGFDADTLDVNVTRAQMKLDQLFDDAVANGMPKDVADTAKAKFTAGNATLDISHDVRMVNKIAGDTSLTAGERATNLSGLENRWQAQYDSGRLQQALGGEQQATDAMKALHSARETAELIDEAPPQETPALRKLITDHTITTKLGARTNWGELRDDFSKMSDRGARFSDVPKIEKFINDQAANQNLKKWVGRAAVSAPVIGGGAAAYEKYGR